MIYVMAEDDAGAVKIGSTKSSGSLKARLIKLNEGNPRALSIIAIAPGDHAEEKRLHQVFRAERQRGEWFSRGELVSCFIFRHRIAAITIKSVWPDDTDRITLFVSACHELTAKAQEKASEAERLRLAELEEKRLRVERTKQERAERAAADPVYGPVQRVRKPTQCRRCLQVGHNTQTCRVAIVVGNINTHLPSLSPFAKASRSARDNWSSDQWVEWRRWFASRRAA